MSQPVIVNFPKLGSLPFNALAKRSLSSDTSKVLIGVPSTFTPYLHHAVSLAPHHKIARKMSTPLKYTHVLQLDTTVKGGLTTESQKDTVGPFLLNDMDNILWGDWEIENLVCKKMAGLDSCNVGVEK